MLDGAERRSRCRACAAYAVSVDWAYLLVAIAVLLVLWLLLSRRRPVAQRQAQSLEHLERRVLSQTLGNRGAMERAVLVKSRQHPRASRAQLLEMVSEDYARDHSR